MRFLILFIFVFGVDAREYDAKDIIKEILHQNLQIKSYLWREKENESFKDQMLGQYDHFLMLKGSQYRDKSLPDNMATPSDIDKKNFSLQLSKKWHFGVRSSLTFSNDENEYMGINFGTFTPVKYRNNKSFLGAMIEVDLSQNFAGMIDRALLANLKDEKVMNSMTMMERVDSYLYFGLVSFYQTLLGKQRYALYEEMKVNALDLLAKAKDRRRRGIIDNRELYIYQANLSAINQLIIQSLNSLEQIKVKFADYSKIDVDHSSFENEKSIDESERIYITNMKNIDFESIAQKSRTMVLLEKEIGVNQRSLRNSQKALLPQVTFSVSAIGTGKDDSMSESFSQSKAFEHPQYAVGINLSYPLENRAARNKKSALKYQLVRKELEYKDSVRKKSAVLKNSADELRRLLLLSEAAQKHLSNENNKYKNEFKEYRRGRSSARDVVFFQNDYLSARLKVLESVISYKIAFNQFLLVAGDFSKYYGIQYRGVEL